MCAYIPSHPPTEASARRPMTSSTRHPSARSLAPFSLHYLWGSLSSGRRCWGPTSRPVALASSSASNYINSRLVQDTIHPPAIHPRYHISANYPPMPSKRPTHDDPSAHPAHAVAAEPTTSAIGDYDLPKTTITKIAKSAVSPRPRKGEGGDRRIGELIADGGAV